MKSFKDFIFEEPPAFANLKVASQVQGDSGHQEGGQVGARQHPQAGGGQRQGQRGAAGQVWLLIVPSEEGGWVMGGDVSTGSFFSGQDLGGRVKIFGVKILRSSYFGGQDFEVK